jgi:hypothetical protein
MRRSRAEFCFRLRNQISEPVIFWERAGVPVDFEQYSVSRGAEIASKDLIRRV